VDVRERPLDRAEDLRERDLLGRLREPVAAARSAARAHEPRPLQLEQDVLQELQRDVLGLGQPLALDRVLSGAGEPHRGPDRVVGFR
jgi:hypothetical protein